MLSQTSSSTSSPAHGPRSPSAAVAADQQPRRIGKVISSNFLPPTAIRKLPSNGRLSGVSLVSPVSSPTSPLAASSWTPTSASPSASTTTSSVQEGGSASPSPSQKLSASLRPGAFHLSTPGRMSSLFSPSISLKHGSRERGIASESRSSTDSPVSGRNAPDASTSSSSTVSSNPYVERHTLVAATLPQAVCIIPGRFYWIVRSSNWTPGPAELAQGLRFHFFSIDKELVYDPFYADFGPLNLAQTWRYCQKVKRLLEEDPADCVIVHRCSPDPAKKANAGYLVGAFQVICLSKSPTQAMQPFEEQGVSFAPFRDATYGPSTYQLHTIACLKGIAHAMQLGWFSYEGFDIDAYEFYEKIVHGDLNWIIPKKFIAFSGPSALASSLNEEGVFFMAPESYVPVFKRLGVTHVVRLNKKQYCRKVFVRQGIAHSDLYFLDGSCPTREIVRKFITLCERESGAIAVHCKAGLGRTGTLIGCYALKNYGFAAGAWIGWNRVCRPGSVLGPQQQFLHEIQAEMQEWGRPPLAIAPATSAMVMHTYRRNGDASPMSPEEKRVAKTGDHGQADRLLLAKRHKSPSGSHSSTNDNANKKTDTGSSALLGGYQLSPVMKQRLYPSGVRLESTVSAETDVTTSTTRNLRPRLAPRAAVRDHLKEVPDEDSEAYPS